MKMKKSGRKQGTETIITVFIVAVFFIFHWLCGTAAPHVVEVDAVLASVYNALLFAVFFFCMLVFFKEERSVFEKRLVDTLLCPVWKQLYLKELALFIAIQVMADLCIAAVSFYDFRYVSPVANLLACVKWLLIYWLAIKNKDFPLCNKRKGRILSAGVCLLPLALGITWSIRRITVWNSFAERFEVASAPYSMQLKNFSFEQTVECVVFELIIVLLLCGYHHFAVNPKANGSIKGRAGFVRLLIRLACVFSVATILAGVKFIAFPKGFFLWNDGFSAHVQSFSTEPEFDVVPSPLILTQKSGPATENIVYEKNHYKVYFTQNQETVYLGTITPVRDVSDRQYTILETPVFLYKNCAICYFTNDSPTLIRFEEINGAEKDEILLAACKALVQEGNMDAFVSSAEYLRQYDPAFVEPYLLRYQKGNFSAAEETVIQSSGYRKDFVQSLADELLSAI